MVTDLEYALLSNLVYNRTDENKLPKLAWQERVKWQEDDSITGFSVCTYENASGDIVIAFAGTNESFWKDFLFGNTAALGAIAPQIFQAMKYAIEVIQNAPADANITFTGHSLGGGIASVLAVWLDREATVFDPAPFEKEVLELKVRIALGLYLDLYSLSDSALSAFLEDPSEVFQERESNVKGFATEGEILELIRSEGSNIGNVEPISVGDQSVLDVGGLTGLSFGGRVTLHSMALLTSLKWSDVFHEAVIQHRYAVEVFSNPLLYAQDPEKSTQKDLIIGLLTQQINGKFLALDEIGADMLRFQQTANLNKGLLALLAEYYTNVDAASFTPLISELPSNGIQVDLRKIPGGADQRGQRVFCKYPRRTRHGRRRVFVSNCSACDIASRSTRTVRRLGNRRYQ